MGLEIVSNAGGIQNLEGDQFGFMEIGFIGHVKNITQVPNLKMVFLHIRLFLVIFSKKFVRMNFVKNVILVKMGLLGKNKYFLRPLSYSFS